MSVKKLSSCTIHMQEASYNHHPDSALLQAIKNNDQQAITSLYQHNYGKVEYFVTQNNGSVDDAKDIYQEAFLVLWRNIQLDRFKTLPGSSLEAYLIRLAKNKWIDHLRSAGYKRTISIAHDKQFASVEDNVNTEDQLFLQSVKTNFNQLGTKCQDLLSRFYYLKQSMRTIASIVGITEATARNNKYRCLEQLRALMKDKK